MIRGGVIIKSNNKIIKKLNLTDLDNRPSNSESRKLLTKNVDSQPKITQFIGLRKVNTALNKMDSHEVQSRR